MARTARAQPQTKPAVDREIEILDAASRAFMRQGFSGTSLDRISDEIQSTKGAIYYYYRSKSDLFFAVHRRAMELTCAAIQPPFAQAGSAPTRLHRMAHAHTLLIMEHLPYLRVAAQGLEMHLLERTSESERVELADVVTLREANEAMYIRVIQQGVAANEFRKVDARLLAKPMLGALNWTSRWYLPRARETAAARNRMADEIATFVTSGLLKSRR